MLLLLLLPLLLLLLLLLLHPQLLQQAMTNAAWPDACQLGKQGAINHMHLSQRRFARAEVFPAAYIRAVYTPAAAALASDVGDVEENKFRM
jgi:hypothetical protein